MVRNNAAIRKKKDRSKWCKKCGMPIHTDKDQRRRMCKKCHKLEKKRWRTPNLNRTKWRGKQK